MFIKALISILAIELVFSFGVVAQEEEHEERSISINSNRKQRNEVGIDISAFQFILGNGANPSLFFRRHFTKDTPIKGLTGVTKATYHAYRFRIGSNLSFEKFTTPNIKALLLNNQNTYSYYNQELYNYSTFFVRIGREKQIRKARFELFYGYDLFFDTNNTKSYLLNVNVFNSGQPDVWNYNYEYIYENRNWAAGVAAIGGFKYFLIPRLCFSAEATINLGYGKRVRLNERNSFDTSTNEYYHDSIELESQRVFAYINPLFAVNIGYYF